MTKIIKDSPHLVLILQRISPYLFSLNSTPLGFQGVPLPNQLLQVFHRTVLMVILTYLRFSFLNLQVVTENLSLKNISQWYPVYRIPPIPNISIQQAYLILCYYRFFSNTARFHILVFPESPQNLHKFVEPSNGHTLENPYQLILVN